PNLPFWTRSLKEAGYRSGYFGKWHVERSDKLEEFGIDEYQVDLRQTGVVSHDGRLEPRITIDQPGYKQFLLAGVSDEPASETREAQLVDLGIEFLERVTRPQEDETGSAPWALFVSTEAPHDPYLVPRELYDRYDPQAIDLPA